MDPGIDSSFVEPEYLLKMTRSPNGSCPLEEAFAHPIGFHSNDEYRDFGEGGVFDQLPY